MHLSNKSILLNANRAVSEGDNEKFLSYCTDDVKWEFVGDVILEGKDAVRQYMQETYIDPPQFKVENLIEESEHITAIGQISLKDKDGNLIDYAYCDVWKLSNGKLSELKAFVIKN